MKNQILNVLRWISIPIAYASGLLGASLLARLISWATTHSPAGPVISGPDAEHSLTGILRVAISPWAAIRFAQYTAPKGKLVVAIVSAVSCILLLICALAIVVLTPGKPYLSDPPAFIVVQFVIIVLSAAFAVWQTYRENEQIQSNDASIEDMAQDTSKETQP
jgi:hypothetical protein